MPLKVKDGMGAWIKDFQKSDAPQFKGRSKDQRRDQAIAAYLSAKRGPQNESTHYDYDKSVEKDIKKKSKSMRKASEDVAGGLTRRIGSLSKVTGASRGRAVYQAGKLNTQRGNVLAKSAAEREIKRRMQMKTPKVEGTEADMKYSADMHSDGKMKVKKMGKDIHLHGKSYHSAKDHAKIAKKMGMKISNHTKTMGGTRSTLTNESIGRTPGDDSYHLLQKAKRMAAKDGHDYDKLPAYDRTHNKHRDYYDQKARNESVKEGMTTGNEAGMMFKVKIEGLPDMIMVGRSPSDIKQQLRKIVKQPSMINSVDRMPKSQVRKMYRDLAGGKDIDENYLADYGTPESVKKMKDMTPGQANSMLDKIMKIRKGKNKKQLGKNDAADD